MQEYYVVDLKKVKADFHALIINISIWTHFTACHSASHLDYPDRGLKALPAKMPLSGKEVDACREAFVAFDKDKSGTIDVWELRQVLEAMGQAPTEEELFAMIAEVDDNMSGSIDFSEFLAVVESQKQQAEQLSKNNDLLDAFVACGGNPDKSGHVKRETLVKIIKHDFQLTIDLEELIDSVDTDGSGEIEYDEFRVMLSEF